jgi:hypothetical protein
MKKIFILILFLTPLAVLGQAPSNTKAIDSIVTTIETDPSLIKKVFDSVTYVREDGGDRWDSLYNHSEYFYKGSNVVKILAWNKYRSWRNDMVAYYQNDKTIKFSEGESHIDSPYYGQLNFGIYYYEDKEVGVIWLTPKPDNVLGVASDIFLKWTYSLLNNRK